MRIKRMQYIGWRYVSVFYGLKGDSQILAEWEEGNIDVLPDWINGSMNVVYGTMYLFHFFSSVTNGHQ